MRKYYVSGLIGSGIPSLFILVLVFWSLGILLWTYAIPVWLIGGFSGGFIGNKLAGKDVVFTEILATAFLGFVIASVMGLLIIFFLW